MIKREYKNLNGTIYAVETLDSGSTYESYVGQVNDLVTVNNANDVTLFWGKFNLTTGAYEVDTSMTTQIDFCGTKHTPQAGKVVIRKWLPYTAYTVGDKVLYGEKLWVCNKDHTSMPGEWVPENIPLLWSLE